MRKRYKALALLIGLTMTSGHYMLATADVIEVDGCAVWSAKITELQNEINSKEAEILQAQNDLIKCKADIALLKIKIASDQTEMKKLMGKEDETSKLLFSTYERSIEIQTESIGYLTDSISSLTARIDIEQDIVTRILNEKLSTQWAFDQKCHGNAMETWQQSLDMTEPAMGGF